MARWSALSGRSHQVTTFGRWSGNYLLEGICCRCAYQALVIKDSWEYEERPEEGLLLKEATEAEVENVARYYRHETVRVGGTVDDVLDNVRKGLSDTIGRNPLQQRAVPFRYILSLQ